MWEEGGRALNEEEWLVFNLDSIESPTMLPPSDI